MDYKIKTKEMVEVLQNEGIDVYTEQRIKGDKEKVFIKAESVNYYFDNWKEVYIFLTGFKEARYYNPFPNDQTVKHILRVALANVKAELYKLPKDTYMPKFKSQLQKVIEGLNNILTNEFNE